MATTDRGLKDNLTLAAQTLQNVAKPLFDGLTVAIPYVIEACKAGYAYYIKLPQNALLFIYGFVFCFFGGTFPVLFSALQAAEYTGRKAVMLALVDLADEAMIIINESKKDDEKDEDKNGKNDVKQISHSEYVARKTKLVLRKMNPEKIDKAISSIYRVWLAVAAVLSIEFARTISMAMAIADFIKRPIERFIAPTIRVAVPDEYEKWIPVILGWIAKSVAMSVAFYIQALVSGFASALKGGLMMAQATYQFLEYHDVKFLGFIASQGHEQSNVDEALSYVFAALGFYTQFRAGFSLPSPLNYILWPFQFAETYLRWSITKS